MSYKYRRLLNSSSLQESIRLNMPGLASLAVLSVLGLANGQSNIGFGPAFSLGPTQSWIREARTTLVLPEAPSPQADRLALWPGMGTSSGDLIQALAVSFSDPAAYVVCRMTMIMLAN